MLTTADNGIVEDPWILTEMTRNQFDPWRSILFIFETWFSTMLSKDQYIVSSWYNSSCSDSYLYMYLITSSEFSLQAYKKCISNMLVLIGMVEKNIYIHIYFFLKNSVNRNDERLSKYQKNGMYMSQKKAVQTWLWLL